VIAETPPGEAGRGHPGHGPEKADYEASVKRPSQADKAYEIQTQVMQQQVVTEQVKVEQVERQEQVKVQDAEILRRERN